MKLDALTATETPRPREEKQQQGADLTAPYKPAPHSEENPAQTLRHVADFEEPGLFTA